ncbi:MAG TPA: hypothetical protein VMM78_04205 [Thermomicrobiales bacterium]|nr:hypothetical protein [Thermomicrobiales bacterium]
MNVSEQVERAIQNHADLPPVPYSDDMPENDAPFATPDRLAFALGWIVANSIVQARYSDSAIDALPIYHPEHGWDRFLMTRRVSSPQFARETANTYGMIMLTGPDAPRVTMPSGKTRISLGTTLRNDPDKAIAETLALFPPGPLLPLDLGLRWKERQRVYPMLYNVVTELILDYPGIIAAREIFVDNQPIDGVYHPLHLHAVALEPAMVYDWFLLQYGDRSCFFRIHGGYTIYETNRKGWATVKKQLAAETPEEARRRILAWLRIDGEPDPKTVD